tara:strand:+ start:2548 stop:3138 length:591 start_codon:yes stop_codon:yes gene_type:complete
MYGFNFTGFPPGFGMQPPAGVTPPNVVRPDTTYSSGFDYARSIAGGIPASQMIAGGVSYSPGQPGGYTQADLNRPPLPDLGVVPLPMPRPTEEDVRIPPPQEFMPGGFMPGVGFAPGDFDVRDFDFSNIRPNIDFRMPDLNIPQMPQPQVGGLFGGLGRIGSSISGAQDSFDKFKDDLKEQAIKGLFGIGKTPLVK